MGYSDSDVVDSDEAREILEEIDKLKKKNLTEWEDEFIESLLQHEYELSDKQISIVCRIARKNKLI